MSSKHDIDIIISIYERIKNPYVNGKYKKLTVNEVKSKLDQLEDKNSINVRFYRDKILLETIFDKTSFKILKVFVEYGADVNELREDGETFLIKAICRGDFASVKLFLEYGADPNLPDKYETFPIQIAVRRGYFRIIQILLKYKANPNIDVNNTPENHTPVNEPEKVQCYNPLYLAYRNRDSTIMELLLKYGAKIIPNNLTLTLPEEEILENSSGNSILRELCFATISEHGFSIKNLPDSFHIFEEKK